MVSVAPAEESVQFTPVKGIYNVADFGAVAGGEEDCTAAFQKAIDTATANGGGIVRVPVGKFLIKTHLDVKPNVTLQGIWHTPQRGRPFVETGKDAVGSVLLAVEGKGSTEGAPFIMLRDSAALKGITVYYPDQVNTMKPHPYPWCVAGEADNVSLVDVFLVNPYQGVDFGSRMCGRHLIRNLYGQALYKGLYINQCYDVGRVENVHWWPFWTGPSREQPAFVWMRENGTAFLIGKSDGQMFTNCFSIRYKIGMHFFRGEVGVRDDGSIRTSPGSGVYTNCYMDETPCAVKIDDVGDDSGVSFVNCMFMSSVEVGPASKGEVKFTACGFWSNPDVTYHANLQGRSTVIFNSCHFSKWDRAKKGIACIIANNERLIVNSCQLKADLQNDGTRREDQVKVRLGENIKSAIITSNLMVGGALIENNAPKSADIQIANNAAQ